MQFVSYYMSSKGQFNVILGPYDRVQNVKDLMLFREESKCNREWVYSPKEGPFRALGPERISQILEEPSTRDPILRLNDAVSQTLRGWYESIRKSLKNKEQVVPTLPLGAESYFDVTKVFDSQGKTILRNCIEMIIAGKAELSALNKLKDMGADFNASVQCMMGDYSRTEVPPLVYTWMWGQDKSSAIMEHLIELGANLNQVFGTSANSIPGFFIKNVIGTSIIPWFLTHHGDLNIQDGDGNSLLHLSLYLPGLYPPTQFSAVDHLIEAGINLTLANKRGEHSIHTLCCYGLNDEKTDNVLKTILEKAPEELNAQDGEGETPLDLSIRTGKQLFIDTIKTKLEPSHLESLSEKAHVYLLNFADYIHGDCRKIQWQGDTKDFSKEFIENSLTKKYIPLLSSILPFVGTTPEGLRNLLIAHDAHQTTLLHKVANSCPWILDHLLEQQYIQEQDLQLKNEHGVTVETVGTITNNSFLLMIACYHLDKKTAKEMLEKEVSLDVCIDRNKSLLHVTIERSLNSHDSQRQAGFEIFEKLLAKGANPNAVNDSGETPLLNALQYKNSDANAFLLELLDYNADPDIANHSGMTPREYIKQFNGWNVAKEAILGAPYLK